MAKELTELTQEAYENLAEGKRLVQVHEGIKLIKMPKGGKFEEFVVDHSPKDATAYLRGETKEYSDCKFVGFDDYPTYFYWELVSVVFYQVLPVQKFSEPATFGDFEPLFKGYLG